MDPFLTEAQDVINPFLADAQDVINPFLADAKDAINPFLADVSSAADFTTGHLRSLSQVALNKVTPETRIAVISTEVFGDLIPAPRLDASSDLDPNGMCPFYSDLTSWLDESWKSLLGVVEVSFEVVLAAVREFMTWLQEHVDPIIQWANDHPTEAITIAITIMGVTMGVAVTAAPSAAWGPPLHVIGFGPGVLAESLAAFIQSLIGNVAPGSIFAFLQSAGAGGGAAVTLDAAVQGAGAVVAVASAWKLLDELIKEQM